MNATELIAAVAANQFNWVKAKKIMLAAGEYTEGNRAALADAVDAAERARNAVDGYARSES